MKEILYILAGVLFVYSLPVLEAFFSLIITSLKTIEQKISVYFAKAQKEVIDLTDDSPQRAIGFLADWEESDDG